MQSLVEDGGGDGPGDLEEGQAQEERGREQTPEEDLQVRRFGQGDKEVVGEGKGEAVDGRQGSRSGEGEHEERQDSGAEAGDSGAEDRGKRQREDEEQYERPVAEEELERGADGGRPKRKRARRVQ